MVDTTLLEYKLANLEDQLRKADEEKNLLVTLEQIRETHRSLPIVESQTILFLVRKLYTAIGEVNRLKNVVKNYEQADKNREAQRNKARTVAVA